MSDEGTVAAIRDDTHGSADRLLGQNVPVIEEDAYRFASELAGFIVWSANPDGQLLWISPRFTEITGEPLGSQYWAIHPDDVERVMQAWSRAIVAGEMLWVEFRLRVKGGQYRYFRARSSPRRDASGELTGWYGFSEDIHERRAAQLDREEMEERYRLAFQATNDALYDLDIPSRLIRWRETGNAFFGYPPQTEPTPLKWWEDRIHPDDRDWVVRGFDRTMASDRTRWAVDYRFLKADGNYADLHDQGIIVRDDQGRALRAIGAMSDVTQQRRAQVELRKTQAELLHLSRRNAMGTMASTLAHELNQPLAAATNFMSAARRFARNTSPRLSPRLLEALDDAAASTQRAGEIVRRLRELVAEGTTSARAENLPQLLEEASFLALSDIKLDRLTHRFAFDPEAEWVWADRIQIQQVMINLIRNSAEAMSETTLREIHIESEKLADGMAEIRVSDTGAGIDPAKASSLFSQFVTTKSNGLGVGLPISRTIIEAHGGRLWAHSPRPGGATFCFTLPLSTRLSKEPPEPLKSR